MPEISETFSSNQPHSISNGVLICLHLISGTLYRYIVYGAAVSEVEIDVLTGEHITRRSDIVMDIGASLNPVCRAISVQYFFFDYSVDKGVDFGQIEGAFVQGMGLVCIGARAYLLVLTELFSCSSPWKKSSSALMDRCSLVAQALLRFRDFGYIYCENS